MAKKQGISYSPNTALIRGAGIAYRNYDNMPGMYEGLDKITKAGTEIIKGAVEGFEAEQKKKEKEAKEAEARKAQQDKDWYDISGSVYENAGSFMKDVEYKDTVSRLTALKPRLIEAQKSGNPEEIATVMTEFNNIRGSVDDHKAFRETITDPEYGISDAMKHSGIVPGDNGEDHNFLTGLVKEDYTIARKNNETYYNVGGVEKTMKEIKDMTVLKDLVPFNAYQQRLEKQMGRKTYDEASTSYFVRNNIVPSDIKGLRAFVADNGFGNGETFLQLLNKGGNRASIEKEIMNTTFNTDGGSISNDEWQNFTNAIIDPKNKFWKGDEQAWQKSTTDIVTRQLTNGIANAWRSNQPSAGSSSAGSANFIIGGQTFNARDFNNSFVPFINKLAKPSEGELFVSPTGMKFKYEKNNYYVYDANTRKIDKDNPMTFNDIAISDGWANYLTYNTEKTKGGGAKLLDE